MRRQIVLGILFAAGALTMTVNALQQPPAGGAQAPRVVEVEKLKDNLFVLRGGGGNSTVFVPDERRHGGGYEESGLGAAATSTRSRN